MTERRKELNSEPAFVPQLWEDVVAACLAKDPSRRPQSAAEVAQRLGITPAQTRTRAAPGKRLNRKTPIIAGIAALCFLALAGYYFGLLNRQAKPLPQAQLGVRLEAAARQDHGAGGQLLEPVGPPDDDPRHRAAIVDAQAAGRRPVADPDARPLRAVVEGLHEPLAASHGLDAEPAPEAMPVLDLEGLAAEHQDPADAQAPHPDRGLARLPHEEVRQVGIGQVLREAHEVVVELCLRV